MFDTIKLVNNTGRGKDKYFGFGFRFIACGGFTLSDGSRFGKNLAILGAEMS